MSAASAVLQRVYHPRPSVRRLASRIAVRLAFDMPSFFYPLGLASPLAEGGIANRDRAFCCGSVNGANDVRGHRIERGERKDASAIDISYSAVSKGNLGLHCVLGGGEQNNLDLFVVPVMVLKAYPRLRECGNDAGSVSEGGEIRRRFKAFPDTAQGEEIPVSKPELLRRYYGGRTDGSPSLPTSHLLSVQGSVHAPGDRPAEENGERCRDGGRFPLTRHGDGCIIQRDSGGTRVGCSNGSGSRSNSSSNITTSLCVWLAAEEWGLLKRNRARSGALRETEPCARSDGEEAGHTAIVARLVSALQSAGRRAEFGAAMLATRAWILAGPG